MTATDPQDQPKALGTQCKPVTPLSSLQENLSAYVEPLNASLNPLSLGNKDYNASSDSHMVQIRPSKDEVIELIKLHLVCLIS